ncbi:MAG: hypothetical protein WA984_11475 [Phormidesmis sp.]
MKIIKLVCLSLLLLLTSGLSGCGVFTKTPPDKAIELAIAHQLALTQQTIARDLGILADSAAPGGLKPDFFKPNFKVEKVSVQNREKVTEFKPLPRGEKNSTFYNEVYRIKGTFEASLEDRYPAVEGAFEVRLGTDTTDEADVKTWYLIESD